MKYKILLNIFLVLILLLLSGINFVLAEGVECPAPPDCPEPRSWNEYQCTASCQGEIQKRRVDRWWVLRSEPGDPCPSYWCESRIHYGEWTKVKTCQPWQRCSAFPGITRTLPICYCYGACLQTPQNPRYFNKPIPKNLPEILLQLWLPFNSIKNRNILLPVKLDWDDVLSWGEEDGAQSYRIRITNARPTYIFEYTLTSSEFIPPPCTLRSNANHTWKIIPCCTPYGDNCKPWPNVDKWKFDTNLAPELVYPQDPDWIGSENKKDAPWIYLPKDEKDAQASHIPLKWCNIDGAQSYYWKHFHYDEEKLLFKYKLILHSNLKKQDNLKSKVYLCPGIITKFTTYAWKIATCLEEEGKQCGVHCLPEQSGDKCGDFSQLWKFTPADIDIPAPEIIFPLIVNETIPVVNFANYLNWKPKGARGAISYYYEIFREEKLVFSSFTLGDVTSVSFEDLWDHANLKMNQKYTWTIRSCWDIYGEQCETYSLCGNYLLVNKGAFKTTGAPPTNLNESPKDQYEKKIIPTLLDWDDMPGSASYKYKIYYAIPVAGPIPLVEGVIKSSETLISYDKLEMGKRYNWFVKTCTDEDGFNCGEWSAPSKFTAFTLGMPVNPDPEDGGNFYTYERFLEWQEVEGANFYQVDFQGERNIVRFNSIFIRAPDIPLGKHTWRVRACLDKNCQYYGAWANWSFTLIEKAPEISPLVPCGLDFNCPHTLWNETDSCELKHIFFLLYNIINFILWRVIPIILVLLVVATGIMFYFSLSTGTTDPISKAKALWRAAGMGFIIIFLGWNLICFILTLFGYQVGIFGLWYEPPI